MNIGVLMGGISREREVSVMSGRSIAQALREAGHRVQEVIITEHFSDQAEHLREYDVCFNALHGYFGEDGKIQRILDSMDIPYTGCGPESSRVLMDKPVSKEMMKHAGINTPRWFIIEKEPYDIPDGFNLPLVVKPPDGGSSVDVSISTNRELFIKDVNTVLEESESALVEEYIEGREVTIGIVGDIILPIIELRTKREFYDFQAKYIDNNTTFLCPAPLSEELRHSVRTIAVKAFDLFKCRDMVRFDLIVDRRGTIYLLEGNTIPGFTDHSLLPMAAKEAGISFPRLCEILIEMALERTTVLHAQHRYL